MTAVFAAHGVPLVDADQISREILLPGSPLLPVLAQRFGADILYADGSLNRRLLADRAFAAPEGKAALDSLVLPEIIRRVWTEAGRPGSRSTAFCDRRSRDRGHRCGKKSATTSAWSLRPLPPVWPALRPGTASPRRWRHGGSTPRPRKKSCLPGPILSCATMLILLLWKRRQRRSVSSCRLRAHGKGGADTSL